MSLQDSQTNKLWIEHGGLGYTWMPTIPAIRYANSYRYTWPTKPFDLFPCETKGCKNKLTNISTKSNQKRFCPACMKKRRNDMALARYHRNKLIKGESKL